jgi:regulatory protein
MDTTLYEKLLSAAFRFVSYRPRSEREIRDFLERKLKTWRVAGHVSVTKALNRLREYGHVDDRKFAEWWVSQRSVFRPKGARALRGELYRKGVPRDVVEDVLSGSSANAELFDEVASARKVIEKKLIRWVQIPIIEQKKKVYTFLAQRGFSSDTIEKIIDELVKKDYNL